MLKRQERYMKLYSPSDDSGECEFMGYFPVSVSYRTSEELDADEVRFTNLRLSVYAERHRSPSGGYRRGMILESIDSSEKYHVLVPVLTGRMWVLKVERVMVNGDGVSGTF